METEENVAELSAKPSAEPAAEQPKKQRKQFFLFEKQSAGLTDRQKWVYRLVNAVCLPVSSFALCVISLMLAYGPYSEEIFSGYFRHPMILLLNTLPILLLQLFLFACTGRQWIAYLLTSLLFVAASIGNYYKLTLRNDPFVFADLSVVVTAFGFAGKYEIRLGLRVLAAALAVPAGTVFLFFFARGRLGRKGRIAAAAAALAPVIPLWLLVYSQKSVYQSKPLANDEAIFRWSETQQMVSKGFVYPFIYSATRIYEPTPDGYSESRVKAILSAYPDADIPADRRVNVIAIQLEAFADLEELGVTGIDPAAYATYHALRENSYSGRLVTNIFAGGTVDTERCFLTGSSVLHYYGKNTPSYVWYLRSQGYQTIGAHPCTWEFYNRRSVNAYLGFEDYAYTENCFRELSGDVTSPDSILFPEVLRQYNAAKENGPVFDFVVTYQGHGPYNTETLLSEKVYWDGEGCSPEAYCAVNNYLASVSDTAAQLQVLLDSLAQDDTPVVVLIYGDHKPWLGNDASIYHELGIDFDLSAEKGVLDYYGTDYIIWANDAAKQTVSFDFTGEAPLTSSGFLMNILFNTLGWKGPAYMHFTEHVRQTIPVLTSVNLFFENDGLTFELSEQALPLAQDFWCVQYYRHRHFGGLS